MPAHLDLDKTTCIRDAIGTGPEPRKVFVHHQPDFPRALADGLHRPLADLVFVIAPPSRHMVAGKHARHFLIQQ
jgi:hypothetical protein